MNLDGVRHAADCQCEIDTDCLVHLKRHGSEYFGLKAWLGGAEQVGSRSQIGSDVQPVAIRLRDNFQAGLVGSNRDLGLGHDGVGLVANLAPESSAGNLGQGGSRDQGDGEEEPSDESSGERHHGPQEY